MSDANEFRVGGSILRLFQVLTVVDFVMSGVFLFQGKGNLGTAALMFVGGLVLLALCLITPGVLTISEDAITVKRRLGTQKLRWTEVARARWTGHGTGAVGLVASAASDNWQVWIEGTVDGKPMTIVLTGPSVEQQARVRELLAEHLPKG